MTSPLGVMQRPCCFGWVPSFWLDGTSNTQSKIASSVPMANEDIGPVSANAAGRTRKRYMTASEKRADGPAFPNTSMARTRCCGLSGHGKAKTSVISAAGSDNDRGPEKWSDISEYPPRNRFSPLPLDRGETRRHHQAVALLHQISCFIGELQIVLPFRIGHHGCTLPRAIARILERP